MASEMDTHTFSHTILGSDFKKPSRHAPGLNSIFITFAAAAKG